MAEEQIKDDVLQLASTIRSLTDQVSSLRVDVAQREPTGSNSSITVQAGGAAVWVVAWIAGLACAFMLGVVIIGGFWAIREFQSSAEERAEIRAENRANKAFLAAIYQQAPHLKPETTEKTDEQRN